MHVSMLQQVLSFIGALLILIAYVGHQLKWMDSRSAAYNLLNVAGSGILAWIALHPFQIGFVVLEFVWAAVSLYAFLRVRYAAAARRRSNS